MAFICKKCWDKTHPKQLKKIAKGNYIHPFTWRRISIGPCEDCHKTDACVND